MLLYNVDIQGLQRVVWANFIRIFDKANKTKTVAFYINFKEIHRHQLKTKKQFLHSKDLKMNILETWRMLESRQESPEEWRGSGPNSIQILCYSLDALLWCGSSV